jgi:putative endonuclease
MKYVYTLVSLDSQHFYIGITDDLRARLAKHNAGEVPHASKYGPWRIKTYIAFSEEAQAVAIREAPEVRLRPRLRKEAPRTPPTCEPPTPPSPHSAGRATR